MRTRVVTGVYHAGSAAHSHAKINGNFNLIYINVLSMSKALQWRKADIAIGKGGVGATGRGSAQTVVLDETDIELPDLLIELQDRTQPTRRTICRVLTSSGR